MESTEMVRTLRPHVTGFSLGFQLCNDHGDEVVAGGKIVRTFNTKNISTENSPNIVYVTIDDGVGELLLLVPEKFWDESGLELGYVAITEGILCEMKKTTIFRTKNNTQIKQSRDDEPLKLLVKEINNLSLSVVSPHS